MSALEDVRGGLERQPRQEAGGDAGYATWGPRDPGPALAALQAEHGGTYDIGVDGHGRWVALRRDGRAALIGDGPDTLLSAIRADLGLSR